VRRKKQTHNIGVCKAGGSVHVCHTASASIHEYMLVLLL
jgi:hypothetical protein